MKTQIRRRILVAIPCILLAYALLGFLVAPRIIHYFVVKTLVENTGREAALEKVNLNPFTFRLELEGLRVLDHDGKPFFAFEGFAVIIPPHI